MDFKQPEFSRFCDFLGKSSRLRRNTVNRANSCEFGRRPNIPEYPEIADYIRQAIDEVYYGVKEPKEALDDAAAKSALILGW